MAFEKQQCSNVAAETAVVEKTVGGKSKARIKMLVFWTSDWPVL